MSIPSTHRALQIHKPAGAKRGTRNEAVVRQLDVPAEQKGLVLVKIHASGFNRRDEWSMMDAYPGLAYENSTFGCDGCGTVVRGSPSGIKSSHPDGLVLLVPTRGWESDEAGPESQIPGHPASKQTNELGGKGFGLLGCTKPTGGVGTFAEYVQVGADQIVDAPKHLDAVQAAALPCGGVTAYRALFTKAQLKKGQTLLITGIGGGVALLGLQLALAAGAKVFVTGGTKEKVERAVQMGAVGGVVYKDQDWPKQLAKLIREKLPDHPYLDAVLDSAGGEVPAQAATAGLKNGGRIVCFGMTASPKMTVTMREVLRNVDVLGSTMGSAQEFKAMVRFVEEHRIVPTIDTVLEGLDEANKGFPLLADADKRSGGKVIVRLAGGKGKGAKL